MGRNRRSPPPAVAAPGRRPVWNSSTSNYGLRAYNRNAASSAVPLDIYLGDGSSEARREFTAVFSEAQRELSQTQRLRHAHVTDGRGGRAVMALSGFGGTVSQLSGGDSGRMVVPGSRAYTREFCVPTTDTHKVYMGYVDPIDLAHAMTAQGFNVKGVSLPLIGQPVQDAHQGLARQVRSSSSYRTHAASRVAGGMCLPAGRRCLTLSRAWRACCRSLGCRA
jgi:hypothetical protein